MNYFDSSALLKGFIREDGSLRVAALTAAEPRLATSKVTYAETHAGLARRRREGSFTTAAHRRVARDFDSAWQSYVLVDLSDALLLLARDLVQRQPLRGFDAIHLASAIALQSELGERVRFVASDARLLEAAGSEGLQTIDVRS